MTERITLGDGRRAQLRAVDGDLLVTYGRGASSEMYRTNGRESIDAARERVRVWAASFAPPVILPPALISWMDRAERIADLVARRRVLVRDLAEMDAEIAAAMERG